MKITIQCKMDIATSGGSKEGRKGRASLPVGVQILSFLCSFWPKNLVSTPTWRPLGKILDPPLATYLKIGSIGGSKRTLGMRTSVLVQSFSFLCSSWQQFCQIDWYTSYKIIILSYWFKAGFFFSGKFFHAKFER